MSNVVLAASAATPPRAEAPIAPPPDALRRSPTLFRAPSLDSIESQEGSASETVMDVRRLFQRRGSHGSWSPHAPRPRHAAPSEGALLQAFDNGSTAASYLGLNALASTSAASFITDGVLAHDATEIGLGVGLMAVAALDALVAEHKTRALTRQLGSFAPRGLSGPHVLTQAGFVAGGALYTLGLDQGSAARSWAGLGVLSLAWLGTSMQLSRLIDALEQAPIALHAEERESLGGLSAQVESTSDITGNPWAVVLTLLGSHGVGQTIRAGNDAATVLFLVAALCGAEVARMSRQGDTLFWLALSSVGAGVLGYTSEQECPWLRFGAGLVVGVGAIHNLYYGSSHPVVRAQARRRHCPTLIPALD